MAFDSHIEDFQRLGMRFARTLDEGDPFGSARAAADFDRRFRQRRDSLPQSDSDRAFSLVSRATDLIDYQLPFASDDAAPGIVTEARKLLAEALELDPDCHDARPLIAAADSPCPNDYHRFLADHAAEVRESCERELASLELPEGALRDATAVLAMRPYVRWLGAEAANALVCGRYRLCARLGEEALSLDPADEADVRFSMALAYAKLEDAQGLANMAHKPGRQRGEAWYSLARMALAFKRCDRVAAEREVRLLLSIYPQAGTTLARQDDLPDGVFARIVVAPLSEDELILATSEATVLLQEGCDADERGTLGRWVATRPEVVAAAEREETGMQAGEVSNR